MKKIKLTIIFSAFLIINTNAQQIQQFSQRFLDILEYNPSIAGSKLNHEIRLHHRSQWAGIQGAPSTQVISYAGAVGNSTGIGAFIVNDKVGANSKISGSVCYAYHIPFRQFNLSLGVGASGNQFKIDGTKFNLHEPQDPAASLNVMKSKITPDISTGFLAYNSNFYFGASVDQLLQSKINTNLNAVIPSTTKFFVMGGYNVSRRSNFTLFPCFIVTGSSTEPMQVDAGIKFDYMDKFLAGFSYRHKDAIVSYAGVRILKQILIAYSFDYMISDLSKYSSGSHEVILIIDLPYAKRKTVRMFDLEENERSSLKLHF